MVELGGVIINRIYPQKSSVFREIFENVVHARVSLILIMRGTLLFFWLMIVDDDDDKRVMDDDLKIVCFSKKIGFILSKRKIQKRS